MTTFTLNGRSVTVEAADDTPLLWVLRDELRMTGTKFGCGIAQCGACTVMIDGAASRSCTTEVGGLEGAEITTIEGISGAEAEAVQAAWIARNVPQCGYCQSGQVVAATQLLREVPEPTDADIDSYMAGNACRCASYVDIRAAIHDAAKTLKG